MPDQDADLGGWTRGRLGGLALTNELLFCRQQQILGNFLLGEGSGDPFAQKKIPEEFISGRGVKPKIGIPGFKDQCRL